MSSFCSPRAPFFRVAKAVAVCWKERERVRFFWCSKLKRKSMIDPPIGAQMLMKTKSFVKREKLIEKILKSRKRRTELIYNKEIKQKQKTKKR